ncbi:MAG: hypothetical protein A3D67_00210 [Candidatus Lloydbacteria bacterium RIFCSPHIGHO2_02_FULL_51_22]|uniref:ABC transporter substrate-binding protein n=2 Tax=Candidatus Lloydiibacteriota TaxID=1817910 RepID=A0A1G2DD67_9BACT|nr:MAG: hypothetical protein A3D67_00210 [Candidatus Lloydbacteria bacterium RIFCSPHIGHO2_02_FULL_51_22]OGZ15711.1 MAG: hypothetical protein A3J08_02490 [Candidatus Lloydbacteria bacterium RIFCSPLOWO2_02_FULL_51_11]
MNFFQLGILIFFGFFIIFGVLVFSGILPFFDTTPDGVGGEAVLWGAVPAELLRAPLDELNSENKDVFSVRYEEKNEESFDTELVEALASGTGPDMILLPGNLLVRHENKLLPLPYAQMSARTFRDTYAEGSELYLGSTGVLALPFSIDPMVMYWNRDLFTNAGIVGPPEEWDAFLSLAGTLTKKDAALNISKSTIALGDFSNVRNAKDILAMLIIQAGNPIVEVSEGVRRVSLYDQRGLVTPPAQSALRFYTEFANPSTPVYSWNRSLPNSRDMFAAGDLAVYFGRASERKAIAAQSPRLNFDVALVPQIQDVERKTTFAALTGIAVLKNSRNPQTAFYAGYALTGKDFSERFSRVSGVPPARRDLLSKPPKDADIFTPVFYNSALIARSWLDPRPDETERIFSAMVSNVLSGRSTISSAVAKASEDLAALF